MKRAPFGIVVFGLSLLVAMPAQVDARSSVQVALFFEFGDDGWRAYGPSYDRGARVVYDSGPSHFVFRTARRSVRVPPGHMPRPGFCRLWYPGRPPGHQPRPRPCGELLRMHRHHGAVIIGLPSFVSGFDGDFRDGRRVRFDRDRDFRFEDERDFRDGRGGRFANERDFRDDDGFDGRGFDDRGFRVVEDDRGFRLASLDEDDGRRGRGRGRGGR